MITNPVLTGFHPDPSMIFVDGVFYIANSTFEYFPGVCISSSTDLANWETVCYPLDTTQMLDMKGNMESCGVWAPCLSYSDGLFYLVFTNVKSHKKAPFRDTPNYITTAPTIKGPWSKPVYINSSGFDPSLFHDDDGRKYFVNMEQDYRVKGKASFTGIVLTELDPLTLQPISFPVTIYKGTHLQLTEGPHLYKKDGWYYCFAAEGGTEYGHAESVARSKCITGPYENHPNLHLMTTRNAPDSPLQKCGHGSICEGPDNRWFVSFLCSRPVDGKQGGRCILGRETAINEITWKDGWPYLLNGTLVPDLTFSGYGEKGDQPSFLSYDFTSERFLLDFQSLRVPANCEVTKGGALRIYGGESPVSQHQQNIRVRRQSDFSFEATTCVHFEPDHFNRMAGLLYRYDEYAQYLLFITYDEKIGKRVLQILAIDHDDYHLPICHDPVILNDGPIYLRLCVHREKGVFSYSYNGTDFTELLYELDASILSDDYTTNGFTGAFVGMACYDLLYTKSCHADFTSFTYRVL